MRDHLGQPDTSSGYASYLLRLWHTQSAGAPVWRASLQSPLTQQVLRFDTLSGLFAFLLEQTGQECQGEGCEGTGPPGAAP